MYLKENLGERVYIVKSFSFKHSEIYVSLLFNSYFSKLIRKFKIIDFSTLHQEAHFKASFENSFSIILFLLILDITEKAFNIRTLVRASG